MSLYEPYQSVSKLLESLVHFLMRLHMGGVWSKDTCGGVDLLHVRVIASNEFYVAALFYQFARYFSAQSAGTNKL